MFGGIRIPEYAYLIISKDIIEANGNKATLVIGQEKVFVNANYQGDENFENEVSGVLKHVRTIHSMVSGNEEDLKFTVLKNVSPDQKSRIRVIVIKILSIMNMADSKKAEEVNRLLHEDSIGKVLLDVLPKLYVVLVRYLEYLNKYKNKMKLLEDIYAYLLDSGLSPNEKIELKAKELDTIDHLIELQYRIREIEKEIKKEIEKIGFNI